MVKENEVVRIGSYIFDAEELVKVLGLTGSREVTQYSEGDIEQ